MSEESSFQTYVIHRLQSLDLIQCSLHRTLRAVPLSKLPQTEKIVSVCALVLLNFGVSRPLIHLLVLYPGANHSELHEEQFMQESQGFFPETSHLLLQNEIHPRSMQYALDNARNATIIYNPSPLPSDQELSRFPWNKIDWLIVNESEATGICRSLNRSRANTTANMSTRELVFLLSAHPSFATTNIICTLGGDGVLAFIPTFHRPKTAHEAPSFMHLQAAKLQGEIRDTTGAGDCFTGYFVQGLMEFGPYAKVGKTVREQEIARILKMSVYVSAIYLYPQLAR